MSEGPCVISSFKFTQSEKSPPRSDIWVEFNYVAQCGDGLAKLVRIIQQSPEIPPTLLPRRPQFHSLAIFGDGLIRFACLTRGGRLCGQGFESFGTVRRLGRRRRCEWQEQHEAREYEAQPEKPRNCSVEATDTSRRRLFNHY